MKQQCWSPGSVNFWGIRTSRRSLSYVFRSKFVPIDGAHGVAATLKAEEIASLEENESKIENLLK